MRAAAIDGFGGPERLEIHEVPVPEVGPEDVLVCVDTAGVGPWDVKARRGDWARGDERFPLILGADGSGVVAALGDRVRGFALGDPVYGYGYGETRGGFYAEYAVLRAEHVAPIPPALDFRGAGALGVAGITALAAIDALEVKAGDVVIVHGASGGVGTLALQLAVRAGARVAGTAGGPEGCELVRRLGADVAIDTSSDDVAAAVRALAPDGADALLLLAGGNGRDAALAALRPGARVAHPNGVEPPPGVRAVAFDGVPNPAAFARLNAAIGNGPFEVPIAAMFSLEGAADAHRRLEGGHAGKIVLVVDATEDAVEKVA